MFITASLIHLSLLYMNYLQGRKNGDTKSIESWRESLGRQSAHHYTADQQNPDLDFDGPWKIQIRSHNLDNPNEINKIDHKLPQALDKLELIISWEFKITLPSHYLLIDNEQSICWFCQLFPAGCCHSNDSLDQIGLIRNKQWLGLGT